jgi:phospholipase/carboxylesterase
VSAVSGFLLLGVACSDGATIGSDPDTSGRLYNKVAAPTLTVTTGISVQSETQTGRPFGLYVPTGYDPSTQWPLAVLLHGNGGSGEGMALDFREFAEAAGVVVIAPNSRGQTWDRLLNIDGQYGADVAHIDAALKWTFERVSVDPARVSFSGFSDGATYAILVGLKNGDLFSRVAAFTPCADVPGNRLGMPLVFISHGIHDIVLPIDQCSRVTVPRLRERGYDVEFVEYASEEGNGHFITADVITQAMEWMAGR